MSGWTSNTDAAGVVARLRAASRVAVVTHAKPDGDAMGSVGALVATLRSIGTDATGYFVGAMPLFAEDFAPMFPHVHLDAGRLPAGEFDTVVVCDTGSWGQLDALADWVRERSDRTVVIDHHLRGDGDVGPTRWIDTSAAAVCEPIAELCAGLADTPITRLPADVATLLYLGLSTDTGFFKYSSVTPRTFRIAADVREAGADTTLVLQSVTQRDRPARLAAMARALASATFEFGGELCVMRLTAQDIHAAKAGPEDLSGIQDVAMSIGSVRAVAIFTEVEGQPEPLIKASLRSKPGDGMVNVSNVTASLGGGGHANAAGLKQKNVSMDQAVANVLKAYKAERNAGVSNGAIA